MVLEYGNVSSLKGMHWYLMEIRSEKTIESTMKRVGKALHGIFRNDPVEIFIPVIERDLDIFNLSTGPYVFVRSTAFNALLRLKQITGVVSLVTKGESNRPSDSINVEDSYVQTLIAQAEEEHRKQALGIEVGSFVRILNGETRDFCGTVEMLGEGRAVVRVTLCTKSILLETPIRNLLNLPRVPDNQKVYYYCQLIGDLVKDNPEMLKLIKEDLRTEEDEIPSTEISIDHQTAADPVRHNRQRTVTALVKRLVMIDGQHNPMEISKAVVTAIKKKEIKPPKNLFILYCIVKDRLMKDYFKKIDSSLHNYREVIKKFGREYKFSANQIYNLDPNLGIPVATQDICRDGRSREARQKLKFEKQKATAISIKKKKTPDDKCGECHHDRKMHKLSPRKETWGRCFANGRTSCFCKRFKEKRLQKS